MKKKFIAVIATLMLSTVCSMPVMAVTEGYDWTFYSAGPEDDLSTNPGRKNDTERNYYLTINAGNISKANIFGARIRKANNAAASPYLLHTSYEYSKPYAYSTAVNTTDVYYMRGKKDDTSTTNTALRVAGRVTY